MSDPAGAGPRRRTAPRNAAGPTEPAQELPAAPELAATRKRNRRLPAAATTAEPAEATTAEPAESPAAESPAADLLDPAADAFEVAPLGAPARPAGFVRLVHPFPSALTAVATCVIALVAGTDAGIAVRLGLAMLALQFAIGAANDFADADRDRMGRPDKPIPGGLVSLREAQIVFVVFAIAGLALAATVRLEALGIALLGLSDGLLYDLRLKGRTLSWLPMAIGVAILPVFAWAGSTGTWPPGLIWIALVAFLAGASLAMMNALADVEVDKAAGITSIAVRLGWDATLALNMGLMAVLQLIVGFSTAISDAPLLALVAEAAGVLLTWVGWRLASLWDVQAARRGWELQAVGIALLGIGWLAALAATGALT